MEQEPEERIDWFSHSWLRLTQDLFQEVIDRYGLKFGASTGWLLKIDECDFCAATLHLEGKWDQGIPAADFEAAIARRHDGVSRIVGQEDIGVSFAIDLGWVKWCIAIWRSCKTESEIFWSNIFRRSMYGHEWAFENERPS